MLSALEREIIEKFHQLHPAAKQRIRALIEQEISVEVEATEFDYDGWLRNVETLRQQLHTTQGHQHPTLDVVGMLRDIREGEDE
jgi:hypothetical protein